MNILDLVINEQAVYGDGNVTYLEKDGTLYLIESVMSTGNNTLFIVPKDEWEQLQHLFDNTEESDDDSCDLFWDKMDKYRIGELESQ